MRRAKAFTLVELLVVIAIIGMLASMLVPAIRVALEIAKANVCMGNLRNIGTNIQLYRQQNRQQWPWIPKVTSDFSAVATGTNRDVDPSKDPKNPGERSLTSPMFLLVRQRVTPGLFVCPGDEDATEDKNVRWDHDDDAETASVFYWDFAAAANVSYSWQAPVRSGDKYVNGMSDEEGAALVAGDKTPAASDSEWKPAAMGDETPVDEIRASMSRNHLSIRVINLLRTDMAVVQAKRPDVGIDYDNVYTASGHKQAGAREGTSLDISRHLSTSDSFLIGPIAEAAGGEEAQ